MSTCLSILSWVWIALCIVHSACADGVNGPRQAIQTAYDQRNAAVQRKDITATLACYAPGFLYVSPEGMRADKSRSRLLFQDLFAHVQSVSVNTIIQKIDVAGKTATVTARQKITETVPPVPDNLSRYIILHQVFGEDVSRDTWIQTANGWQLAKSKILSRTPLTPVQNGFTGPVIGILGGPDGTILYR